MIATSWVTAAAAAAGGISLLLCATVTTYCAVTAELQGMEPSLRGLVHAGVMILFAGICIEPIIRMRPTTTTITTTIHDHNHNQNNDAQGMGIIFATLGMIFIMCFMGSAAAFVMLQSIASSVLLLLLGILVLILYCCYRIFLIPVLNLSERTTIMTYAKIKSLLTFFLFVLASCGSLLDTSQAIVNQNGSGKSSTTTTILILDAMAYVFHRAFIGTLLVGGGFGSSNNDCSDSSLQRQDLRCRYRAYFSIICLNLGISWILVPKQNDDDDDDDKNNITNLLLSSSGFGMVVAGLLQVDEIVSFYHRQFQNRAWIWNLRLLESVKSMFDSKGAGGISRQFVGKGYSYCVLSFVFYSCTLFFDGVLLHKNDENQRNGFDGCLTRSIHVAAVLAAMVAIFPRLLIFPNKRNKNDPLTYQNKIHNTIVKGVVALMSTVDVIICSWLIFQPTHKNNHQKDQLDSHNANVRKVKNAALCLRIIGATLQASTFAALRMPNEKLTITTDETLTITTEHSIENSTNDSTLPTEKVAPVDPSNSDQAPLVEGGLPLANSKDNIIKIIDNNSNTLTFLNNRNIDGYSVLAWLVYFIAHVFHSVVSPGTFYNHSPVSEIQLSKIFHFQVITLGFYTTSIFRQDAISWSIVTIFAFFEIAGILACHQNGENLISMDRIAILLASLTLLLDSGIRQSQQQHYHTNWMAFARDKKEEGAGAVLFPS